MFPFVVSIFISILSIVPANVINNSPMENDDYNEPIEISSFSEDVTGDGFHEDLSLMGVPFSKRSNFYKDVWLDINNKFTNRWKISLESGYNPKIHLINLTNDGATNMFYQVNKTNEANSYSYQLYSLNQNKVTNIPLPTHNYLKIKLINNFRAEIQLNPNEKGTLIDFSNAKENYIDENIYSAEGKLLDKDISFTIPSPIFEPIILNTTKGHGLKSTQQLNGLYPGHKLGSITTIWHYKDEQWIIIDSSAKINKA